jgi:hypothetical protein
MNCLSDLTTITTSQPRYAAWLKVRERANLIEKSLDIVHGYRPNSSNEGVEQWFIMSCALQHVARSEFIRLWDDVVAFGFTTVGVKKSRMWVERRYLRSVARILSQVARQYDCQVHLNSLFVPISPLKPT